MADPLKKRYRYIWYVTFERTMMILACIVGINCAIGLYHSAVNGELTARVSSTLVQSPLREYWPLFIGDGQLVCCG